MGTPRLEIAFHVAHDGPSGTYFRYHNLAVGLHQRGHRVTIYTQGAKPLRRRTEYREGVRYEVLPRFFGNSFFDYTVNPGNVAVRALQRTRPADVHHLFQPFANAALPWLRLLRRRNNVSPLFIWDWDDLWSGGLFTEPPRSWWRRWQHEALVRLERGLPRRADFVTTCSEFLADLARRRGATGAEVIHNGFWPESSNETRHELRKRFGLRAGSFYLGFIGWTPTEISWCLEALASLDEGVRLVACGYDIRRESALYPKLAGRIEYLGSLSPPDAKNLMRSLDAGLLPLADSPLNRSRLPIKFADYLSAGCPAICGSVGEIRALGSRLKGAILLPPHQREWVDGCVTAVTQIRQDATRHRPDQSQLEALLAWPILAERLEQVYLREAERRQASSAGAGSIEV